MSKTLEELIAETWPDEERMEPVEPAALTPEEAAGIVEHEAKEQA